MLLNTWGEALSLSFQSLWAGIMLYIPNIILAVIILVLGWVAGIVIGKWIAHLIKIVKLDGGLKNLGVEEVMNKAGYKLNSGLFIGALIKWFIIIAFLVSALNVLGLTTINDFLKQVIFSFVPQVIAAVLILAIAAVVAEFLSKIVVAMTKAADVKNAGFFGLVARWIVWIFAIIIALSQIGFAAVLFQTVFIGVVAMLAIALGLAFGLGGKDTAGKILDKLADKISDR